MLAGLKIKFLPGRKAPDGVDPSQRLEKPKGSFSLKPARLLRCCQGLALLGLVNLISGCHPPATHMTLEKILASGEITVITRNNAHCYYFYRDEAMGFEYDLARAFADDLGVKLKVKVIDPPERMVSALDNGGGAFIAASLAAGQGSPQPLAFSDAYMLIQQHILVHRDHRELRGIEDLTGKTIHVRKGSVYQSRLEELRQKGARFRVVAIAEVSTEELIRRVAEQEIEFTVASNHVALLNRRYHPQVKLAFAIEDKQYLRWAVHPQAGHLKARINDFFRKIRANGKFSEIYNRYYGNLDAFDYLDHQGFQHSVRRNLPKYRKIIQAAAEKHGFDWRLIVAQLYQESHFWTRARSYAGGYGLMQLTRSTAQSLGVTHIFAPEENISAGVKHLKTLYDTYNRAIGEDRLFITLAAYNIGQGHIQDARVLARERGLNPEKWSSLKAMLLLLKEKKYYQQSQYGYCRGDEPITYVKQIMIYFDILKKQAIEGPVASQQKVIGFNPKDPKSPPSQPSLSASGKTDLSASPCQWWLTPYGPDKP